MIVELHQSLLCTDFQDAQGNVLDAFLLQKYQFLTSIFHLLLRTRLIAVYVPLMLMIGILLSNL